MFKHQNSLAEQTIVFQRSSYCLLHQSCAWWRVPEYSLTW